VEGGGQKFGTPEAYLSTPEAYLSTPSTPEAYLLMTYYLVRMPYIFTFKKKILKS